MRQPARRLSSAPEAPNYADDLLEELDSTVGSPGDTGPVLPADRFIDREASWLDFNARVLELACDETIPLLERVRFCAIFAVNLDEFFMVRVAGLKRRVATGIVVAAPSGLGPGEQLELIARRAHELMVDLARTFNARIVPALAAHGIDVVRREDLRPAEREDLHTLFRERIYPVLTPLAVDPAHPFPYISGLSLNLAVVLRDRDTGAEHFARVKVPPLLPRFVPLADSRFVPLEDIIAAHLDELFPGLDVLETHTFRVTRNEDLEVEEEEVENLLQALERELMRRRFGAPVRLEIDDTMSDHVRTLLVRELDISADEVYRLPRPLDLAGLWPIADLDRRELKYDAFVPVTHPRLQDAENLTAGDVFAALRGGDVLVHHPYESFATSVQELVEQAAADPNVLAIKQTLYRAGGDSPIVDALIDAAEAGKQVLVVVEIKARFDEQANIRWARKLEQAGCHVVYGLVGLKTHCKICLVVRMEEDGTLRRYVHVGTGNYNPKTARIYEDVGLLTADRDVGADLADLFNHLSGYTRNRDYRRLLVAPDTLRPRLIDMIEREADTVRGGCAGRITMKVNSLVDEDVIDALYRASQAGVPIDLIVRGMCALRPGVPGLSETIRVRSILGRFLEHSRIMRFHRTGKEELWIGSADVMHRNLDRRVEVLLRVDDAEARARLSQILDLASSERTSAWTLAADGRWQRHVGERMVDFQAELVRRTRQRIGEGIRSSVVPT